MKFKLNCSPHLTMPEIIKKLFNCKFLSDVQFSVDGQIIYAHSLMLMMRSEVFEIQFEETFGEQKLIPITDCSYDNFLEFIRFIYKDQCEINDRNGIALLKLATKYKLISLENRVNNFLSSVDWYTQLFGHCVSDKYEIARNRADYKFRYLGTSILTSKHFLTFHPDAVNAVLDLEMVHDVTEFQIFGAFTKWFNNYCELNQMSLAVGREKFEHFIRKIRFPVMSTDEIRDCAKNNLVLLNESDCISIAKQVLYGDDTGWISKPRQALEIMYEWRDLNRGTSFETKFAVSRNTILHGFWIGVEKNRKEIEIEIIEKSTKTNECEKIQFTQCAPAEWYGMLICLGDSIRVRPSFEYTIVIKYLKLANDANLNVVCRTKIIDLIYNNPENSIKTITAVDNMLEMIFRSPPETESNKSNSFTLK